MQESHVPGFDSRCTGCVYNCDKRNDDFCRHFGVIERDVCFYVATTRPSPVSSPENEIN